MKNRPIGMMLNAVCLTVVQVCIAEAGLAMVDQDQDSNLARARRVVEEHLSKLQAQGATITPIADKAVRALFPDDFLFGVRFRMYPVAMMPPNPLRSQNLLVVHGEMLSELTSIDALKSWFQRNLKPQKLEAKLQKTEAGLKQAVGAWLAMSTELKQDGFYKFAARVESMEDSYGPDEADAGGRAVVVAGGKGEVHVSLHFMLHDNRFRLNVISETSTVKPGVRPICQATKLLDRDPIVRRMAEQDILVMGRAARPYLDEQSAKANPKLRRAIDRIWRRIVDEGW